ncbi:MAG: hypothetical protein DWQ01_21940 [Planctomycetota bacterium]|nr:MAG: hypothetical protein DWQ01_21940 [Planctomycetota bacterium]
MNQIPHPFLLKKGIHLTIQLAIAWFPIAEASGQTDLGPLNLPSSFQPLPYVEDFETLAGVVPSYMAVTELDAGTLLPDPEAWTNIGQRAACTDPWQGAFGLEMGLIPGSTNYHDVRNALVIGLDGSGFPGSLDLSFVVNHYGEETDPVDGVWISGDGILWYPIYQEWGNTRFNQWASANQFDLSGTPVNPYAPFYLAFVQEDNFPFQDLDGVAIDQISIPSSSEPLWFDGLENWAIGSGTVLYPSGNQLFAKNFHPNPVPFGLRFSRGESAGSEVGVQSSMDPLTTPAGVFMEHRSYGTVNGNPNSLVLTQKVEATGTTLEVFVDGSFVGATTKEISFYQDGILVHQYTNAGNNPDATILSAVDGETKYKKSKDPDIAIHCCLPVIIIVGDTLNQTYHANEIKIRLVDPTDTVNWLGDYEIVGFNVPEILVTEEALLFQGAPHSVAGEAKIAGVLGGSQLEISNIGSSGQDGLHVGLHAAESYSIQFSGIDLSNSGASIEISNSGYFNQQLVPSFGPVTLSNHVGDLQVAADYSPIGASEVRLEFWRNGAFLGATQVPGGASVGSFSGVPSITECGKLPPDPPCLWIEVDQDTPFTASDGTSHTLDELRILAGNSTGTIQTLETFDFILTQIPDFQIVDEGGIYPIQLSVSSLVAGTLATASIKHASPNSLVVLGYSFTGNGPTTVGTPCGSVDVALSLPISSLGPIPADSSGNAQFQGPLPPSTAGMNLWLQAVELSSSGPCRLSNSLAETIQ